MFWWDVLAIICWIMIVTAGLAFIGIFVAAGFESVKAVYACSFVFNFAYASVMIILLVAQKYYVGV